MPVEEPPPPAFALEPDNIDALIEQYTVENKIPAREPGFTLMLTSAVRRDGSKVEMLDNQRFKLWMVSCLWIQSIILSNQ